MYVLCCKEAVSAACLSEAFFDITPSEMGLLPSSVACMMISGIFNCSNLFEDSRESNDHPK